MNTYSSKRMVTKVAQETKMTPGKTYTLNCLLLLLCDVDVVGACWWVTLFAIVSFVQELQESLLVLVDELRCHAKE